MARYLIISKSAFVHKNLVKNIFSDRIYLIVKDTNSSPKVILLFIIILKVTEDFDYRHDVYMYRII